MTTVAEFVVAAEADAWRDAGFTVDDVGCVQLGGIRIRLEPPSGDHDHDHDHNRRTGIIRWVLAGAPDEDVTDIDGLTTAHADPPTRSDAAQPNGVTGIDHVVVNTADLERTCDAIAAATGAPLKRIREAGTIRQGFHRLGELIVEVVTHPQVAAGPAEFWGLAFNVADLDATFDRVGEAGMTVPKTAVQPGRRIASFRKEAGLGLPIAVMSTAT